MDELVTFFAITMSMVFFFVFLSSLLTPAVYGFFHSWIRETDPRRIADKNVFFNYVPLMASLSWRMNHFYRYWTFVSFVWGISIAAIIPMSLLSSTGSSNAVCFPALVMVVVYPLILVWSSKFMFNKYRKYRIDIDDEE